MHDKKSKTLIPRKLSKMQVLQWNQQNNSRSELGTPQR
jgi:hypothetical protein